VRHLKTLKKYRIVNVKEVKSPPARCSASECSQFRTCSSFWRCLLCSYKYFIISQNNSTVIALTTENIPPRYAGWWWNLMFPNYLSKIYLYLNKCIGDDTKAATRQSLNCSNNQKIKYGEKRFSICRMEFLHPAMWHDHDIDFVRWLHPAMWHVAVESWQALGWRAIEFAQTSAILEFYIWFRFRPHHPSPRHSAPVCEILSKSDHPRQKKMT